MRQAFRLMAGAATVFGATLLLATMATGTTAAAAAHAAKAVTKPQVVTLTDADSGRHLALRGGTAVQVKLGPSTGTWSMPQSSNSAVLAATSTHRRPKGEADGRFRAGAPGAATLTATSAPACAPMCKIADRLWTVTVDVVAPAGAHAGATEADNGTTMALHRGDTLTVTLHSTYWTIQGSSRPTVLMSQGPATTQGEPPSSKRCVPGQGCGTVTESFTAAGDGTADVTASRTTCGEAMRCTTPAQSNWVLHVVVTG
jgi:predicted secreted protein